MQQEIVFRDKVIHCKDCGRSFVHDAGSQAFYFSKGLNEPRRCPACRELRKQSVVRVQVSDD